MNSTDNNSHFAVAADDSFDLFLRSQLQQAKPYLPNEDFTHQVMARLPVTKKISRWQEQLIIFIPLIVISLLVLSQHSVVAFAIRSWVLLSVITFESLFTIIFQMSVVIFAGAGYWFARKCRWL